MRQTIFSIALSLALLAGGGTALAADGGQVYQKATLKNGSTLYGFIEKNDGLGNLVFHTDSAVILFENVEADINDRTFNRSQLSREWQNWADANRAWQGVAPNQTLTLSDVSVRKVNTKNDNFLNQRQGKTANNVKVLERGVKYKYVEMTPNSYSVKWEDIVEVTSEKRPSTALSGINTTLQTKNGQAVEGQYAGETRSTISVFLDNGVKHTMKKDDVVKYSYRAINADQTIFQQSPLLDIVRTHKAGSVTGIIIEQNYGTQKDSDNYILLHQPSGTIQSFRMSDIDNISKEANKQYAPEYDIILKAGEVFINGTKATQVPVTWKKGVNTLADFKSVSVKKGANDLTAVKVQYSAATAGKNVEAYRLVPLKSNTKGKATTYTFTDEALATSVYRPVEISTSVNQTTKAVYNLNGAGSFALYDPKAKEVFCILVTQ